MEEGAGIAWPGSEAAALEAASACFKAGRHSDAAALYAQILERNPDQAQALFYLGLLRCDAGEFATAEPLLTRALALDPDGATAPFALHRLGAIAQQRGDDAAAVAWFERAIARVPDFAAAVNDLGVSLHRLGRYKEGLAALDRAVALDPRNLMAHRNRGLVLAGLGQDAEAVRGFREALALAPDSAELWTDLGVTCLKLEDFAEAEAAFRSVLELDPASIDAHFYLAEALDRSNRLEEADRECREAAQRQGVLVKPCTGPQRRARVLLLGGAGMCNTPTRYLFGNDRYETVTVNVIVPEGPADDTGIPLDEVPACDLVFNAIADADRGAPFIAAAGDFCRAFARPVLNPPERIAATRRDLVSARLADIPGLVVPTTKRVTRAELERLAATDEAFAGPTLVRPAGSHGGHDLKKLLRTDELAAYLGATPFRDYYLTDFVDYRSADGYYRKYRLIFVDREVYPYHLAIASDWLLHYWRADMREARWREEEAAFLADLRTAIPGALAEAVREVARRLDLDYGGMDCAITQAGKVLLFEANATMLVHLDDSAEDFAYKHRHVPIIAAAIDKMVAKKLTG